MTTIPSDLLPTGLPSLDAHIDGGGFSAGSVVVVRAPANSVGRRLAFNLCGDRPLQYLALGHDAGRYRSHLDTATDGGSVSTESFELGEVPERLLEHLETTDPQEETTVLVDPMTPVERLGDEATAETLSALHTVVSSAGGLGVVLALSDPDGTTPEARWATLSSADAVLSVVHTTSEESVRHHLAVDRLPMGQQFRVADDGRVFELPASLEMRLDTSKTLSP